MNYFVVFQNQTFKQEHKEGILWAPQKSKNGGNPKFHWSSMLDCRKGDVVFSIVKNKIKARGVVIERAVSEGNPFDNDLWGVEGWLVKIDYYFTDNNIKIMDELDKIKHLLPKKYSPFNPSNGKGNQGYLYPIDDELGEALDSFVHDTYYNEETSDIFEIDLDESEMIREVFDQEGIEEGEVILIEVEPPGESNKPKTKRSKVFGRKTDFIKKAEKDKKTGVRAELLVVNYEKQLLIDEGRRDLSEKVKWVAKEADGFGYDVLSYDVNGLEKYIEVKGTVQMKTKPFDISSNEVKTSNAKGDQYWIYRVFYVNEDTPKFYKYNGRIEENFDLIPSGYKAYIKE